MLTPVSHFLGVAGFVFKSVIMKNLQVLSTSRRWHRSYRTLHFRRLFSVSSCLKITRHLFWKDLEGLCASMQSSRYLISFFDENSTGSSYSQCHHLLNSCWKLHTQRGTYSLPPAGVRMNRERLRFHVNRDKSDVMTSFGMIDWSDVCRVFRQACSSS
jgi:hypothetical protein